MSALSLLPGIGMMALAWIAVLYWRQRSKVASTLFLWGALAWITGVVLKSAASIPTPAIANGVRAVLSRYFSEPILWLHSGLLTGIFECGITLAFAWTRRIRMVDWGGAVAFGLGFGAIEAFLLGMVSFLTALLTILIPDRLPSELLGSAASGAVSPLVIPVPIVERATFILLHAFSCVLILYAARTKVWKWFWISFFYKTVVDGIAGFINITYGVQNLTILTLWAVEIILLPFGLVGLWGLWTFPSRWKGLDGV